MDKFQDRIKAEFDNIDEVFNEMPLHSKLPYLSTLELAGVAALLHNFYSGIENILKQILASHKIIIQEGKNWHKNLLEESFRKKYYLKSVKTCLANI